MRLGNNQRRIVDYIYDHPGSSVADILRNTNYRRWSTYAAVARLCKRRLVMRVERCEIGRRYKLYLAAEFEIQMNQRRQAEAVAQ